MKGHSRRDPIGIGELMGKVIVHISGTDKYSKAVIFTCVNGGQYALESDEDFSSSVCLEDLTGDIADLIGTTIIKAEERTDAGKLASGDTFTWTFYELATIKGSVTIRWLGSSDRNYSESVSFSRIVPPVEAELVPALAEAKARIMSLETELERANARVRCFHQQASDNAEDAEKLKAEVARLNEIIHSS